MRMILRTLLLIFATSFFTACSESTVTGKDIDFPVENSIRSSEAGAHVGERKVVCGKVTRAYYARSVTGSPTFLNMDDPEKNIFTIVIWGKDRDKFSDFPEVLYDNQELCVRGLILSFQGTAEIQVKSPMEMRIMP